MTQNLLFLTSHLPWPPISGGRRRELELLRRVAAGARIHLLVVSKTLRQDKANLAALADVCEQVEVFAAESTPPADTRLPLQVMRHRSLRAGARMSQLLGTGRFDLVHVEGFHLMQHLPPDPAAPVLLVEQNVEYELAYQHARATAMSDLRAYADTARTRAAELSCWRAADHVAFVTREDRDTATRALPGLTASVVEDGADHIPRRRGTATRTRTAIDGSRPSIVFVANFAYAPNVDAASYLLDAIVPRLRARVPDVRVWLVGNAPPANLCARADDRTVITGRVEAVAPYLDGADAVVCPLRIGGGIKVKVIEALRRHAAIVSSPLGVQGLPERARDALLVAGDAESFAAHTADLLGDQSLRDELRARAARAAGELITWDQAAAQLAALYDELASDSRQRLARSSG